MVADSLTELSSEKADGPKFIYLHVAHGADSGERVWNMAKNADIILLELVADKGLKRDLEIIINAAAQEGDEFKKRVLAIAAGSRTPDSPFATKIITEIINAGKEIHFIDSDFEANEVRILSNAYSIYKDIRTSLEGGFTNAYKLFKKAIHMEADSNIQREHLVAQQIDNFVEANSGRLNGKTIAVIQGAIHTGSYHKTKTPSSNINSRREFDKTAQRLDPYNALKKRVMFNKNVNELDYLRAFVTNFVLLRKIAQDKPGINQEEMLKKAVELGWKITDKELQRFLEKPDGELKASEADLRLVMGDIDARFSVLMKNSL